MSEESNVQDLLRQGIEAAREGKKVEARKLFEKVVELDDKNEKGWLWMASVVDTDEERRVCLGNVLFINPANERAQKAMEKIESRERELKDKQEVIPGITRRQLTLYAGGGIGFVLLILLLFIVITSSRNAQIAAEQAALVATSDSFTAVAVSATQVSIDATSTQLAIATPTLEATATFARATLPPEFTAVPTATLPVTATPLPPPSGVDGRLVGWSGEDANKTGYLPIGIFPLNAVGQFNRLGESNGRDVDVSADTQHLVYTRYFPVTFDFGVEQLGINGSDATVLSDNLQVIKAQMPSYCDTANTVAFVALPADTRNINFGDQNAPPPYQVYVLDIAAHTVSRLTNDQLAYSYPAMSPDCTRIAVVKNDAANGTDIVMIDTATLTQTPVTNDLTAFVESQIHWSPDGTQLIYAAYQANAPENNDIIIRPADGSGTPLLPIRDPSNDIYPVLSPDGRYIAFSSNRNGFYDIYIYDQTNSSLSQLTYTKAEDYVGAWIP